MIDFLTVLLGILVVVTVFASVEYYRRLREARREYENAKSTVEDIVLSFNRELKREAERLELVAYKIEGSSAKADANAKRVDLVEKKIEPLENQLSEIVKTQVAVLSQISEANKKVQNLEAEKEALKSKISGVEEQLQKLTAVPEIPIEPVIPIKRDKAMSALTETEIAVLEMLFAEGAKTAPEIRERVQLSREHTARLMKKLYEKGYLERETGKIPFRYSVKKEMEKFLKKPESPQT
ncbi:MarR family transcriptional regulator [Candidatus Bathyarchaeota archaeon A05DMB-2]|nr:MarR family transcriptional regulator [Candidatus Bathyarchaeota archaeon A05DMB-2]